MLPQETDVLIVGAGPAGLALAVGLQQAGLHPVIVDRLAAGQNTSRAAVIHAHTLEVLERLGIADALERRGLPLTRFALRDHDKALFELDFSMLPSRYAQILMLPQLRTNATDVLCRVARRRAVCASWPGRLDHGRLRYAVPDHPECLDEDAARALVVDLSTNEGTYR